ncbi:MAG: hypothetical protein V9E90_09130 [Saprospiraceae bacterium]|jgi:hypothetical protein
MKIYLLFLAANGGGAASMPKPLAHMMQEFFKESLVVRLMSLLLGF